MNDTAKPFLRHGRARVLAILATGALLGSALATAPIIAGVAGAAVSGGSLTATPGDMCANAPTLVTLTYSFPDPVVAVGIIPPGVTLSSSSSVFTIQPTTPITSSVATTVAQVGSDVPITGGIHVSNVIELELSSPTDGGTVSFYATATAPGAWTVQGDADWGEGFPDPDNSGDNADDYTATATETTVDAGCKLVFTAQPATTALNGGSAPISSVLGGGGAPVAVQVQDSTGNPEPVSTPVSLAISADGPLSNSTATTSGGTAPFGTASFTGLSNALAGLNLTLTASAAGVIPTGATSGLFNIYTSGTTCTGSCSTSPAPGFNLSATGSGFLAASVNPISLSCSALRFGLYPGIPGTTTLGFTYVNGGTKTVTFFVAQSLLTTLSAKLLALHYMVCYTSPVQFKTVFGLPAAPDPLTSLTLGAQYYTGLLPDCAYNGNTAPCVKSRTIVTKPTPTYPLLGVYVAVSAPAGDPFGR